MPFILKMDQNILFEACVETRDEAILAERMGAHRIELCSRLDLDGLSPDKELIKKVTSAVGIPVKVMIRPRSGSFIYNLDELNTMKRSIQFCKNNGVQGVVFGMLDTKNMLQYEQIEMLSKLASPLEVTIHKAIDRTPDPVASVSGLLQIENITSVLTSGGAESAFDGYKIIKEMMRAAKEKITIIAAGKITKNNLVEVHQLIGAREYHGRKIVGALG